MIFLRVTIFMKESCQQEKLTKGCTAFATVIFKISCYKTLCVNFKPKIFSRSLKKIGKSKKVSFLKIIVRFAPLNLEALRKQQTIYKTT